MQRFHLGRVLGNFVANHDKFEHELRQEVDEAYKLFMGKETQGRYGCQNSLHKLS